METYVLIGIGVVFVALIIWGIVVKFMPSKIVEKVIRGYKFQANKDHLDQLPTDKEADVVVKVMNLVYTKWSWVAKRLPTFRLARNPDDLSPVKKWNQTIQGYCMYFWGFIGIWNDPVNPKHTIELFDAVLRHELAHYVTHGAHHEDQIFIDAEKFLKSN